MVDTRDGTFPLLLVGTDHRRTSLALRERLAYAEEERDELLIHLLARREVAEACLLSTCNRTEVYLLPRDEDAAYRTALDRVFLTRAPEIEQQGRLYVKRDEEAAQHLLRVASGLESMVLGEPEILGQVRQAAASAEAVGAGGTVLRRLLRTAVAAGGRIRQETAITAGAVSFGYAVVELAKNIFSRLGEQRVLLVGTGEMGRQVARNLQERGLDRLVVTNRSHERAKSFAGEFPGAVAVPFEGLSQALTEADLVVTSTAAERPIVLPHHVEPAVKRRRGRPLLLVDLGVPRNIESAVRKLDSVFLHDMDSLEGLIDHNLARRREEIPKVEAVLDQELARFRAWYRSLEAEPLIARLQKRAEEVRAAEVARALPHFDAKDHEALERLTRTLVRKILHHPSSRLRQGDEDALSRLDLVRELFQLQEAQETRKAERSGTDPDERARP